MSTQHAKQILSFIALPISNAILAAWVFSCFPNGIMFRPFGITTLFEAARTGAFIGGCASASLVVVAFMLRLVGTRWQEYFNWCCVFAVFGVYTVCYFAKSLLILFLYLLSAVSWSNETITSARLRVIQWRFNRNEVCGHVDSLVDPTSSEFSIGELFELFSRDTRDQCDMAAFGIAGLGPWFCVIGGILVVLDALTQQRRERLAKEEAERIPIVNPFALHPKRKSLTNSDDPICNSQ